MHSCNNSMVTDFGGNLQVPKLSVGESFYLRKLRVFNYGVYLGLCAREHVVIEMHGCFLLECLDFHTYTANIILYRVY